PSALTTYQIVSFGSARQKSIGKARDVAELARAHPGVIAEEAREMRRLRKAEALAECAEGHILMHHRIEYLLHAYQIQIDLWRYAERSLEQAKKLRTRQARVLGELVDAGARTVPGS